MKLASLKQGGRDGTLIVVSRDLSRAVAAASVAPNLQAALDNWAETAPRLAFLADELDAVGWHGTLSPLRLNIKDIRPVTSARYHLPPSAHTTFTGERFVVCTFAPRPFETDPGALKVPFFHNNDDYDEVIFYHAGDFFSRDDIKPGMMTFHPAGFTHGPHPKALKNMLSQPKPATDEYAVMIDARDPLEVGEAAATVENPDYVNSWSAPA